MLSIGVMSARHAGYYIDLAQEDYYQAGGEPLGKWFVSGCANLGVQGQIKGDEFRNVFRGYDPWGKVPLTQRQQHEGRAPHRAGWDLTFSAPKSVSTVWSQASPAYRKRIEAAHEKAVNAALGYIERAAGKTRRGKGGRKIEDAKLVFACFEHGTSRAHDPQLHTHSLLLNVAVRSDGTTGAVSSKSVFDHKMAAGAVYRAELATRLSQDCGLEVERTKDGFEIKGVSEPLCKEFSKRRAEILKTLENQESVSAKSAARATLESRTAKETKSRNELFSDWQSTGRTVGWSREEADRLFQGPQAPKPRPRIDIQDIPAKRGFIRQQDVVARVLSECVGTGRTSEELLAESGRILSNQTVDIGSGRYLPLSPSSSQNCAFPQGLAETVQETKTAGWSPVLVFPSRDQAEKASEKFGVTAVAASDFLSEAKRNDAVLADALETFMDSPTPKELVHKYGPDMTEALRNAGKALEAYLRRNLPSIDLGLQRAMKKYGPDITEIYRYLKSKCELQSALGPKTCVLLVDPERLAAREAIAVAAAAKLASSKIRTVVSNLRWVDRRQHEVHQRVQEGVSR